MFVYQEQRRWAGFDYEYHMGCLENYHDLSVAEMRRRGYTGHQTPWPEYFLNVCGGWEDHVQQHIRVDQIRQDMLDLAVRWEKEEYVPQTERQIAIVNFGQMLHAQDPVVDLLDVVA